MQSNHRLGALLLPTPWWYYHVTNENLATPKKAFVEGLLGFTVTWWYHHWAGTMIRPELRPHVLELE
jgi:hypothetical protein